MSRFIRVLGDDPDYNGMQKYLYVDVNDIYKVVPYHAVKGEDNTFWLSRPETKNAVIASYRLFDRYGNSYSCGSHEELNKIGISLSEKRRKIGFISNKEDSTKKEAVDITE